MFTFKQINDNILLCTGQPLFTNQGYKIFCYVIYNDNIEIGGITYNSFRRKFERILYIRELVIDEEHRRKGYATAIISKLLDDTKGSFDLLRVQANNSEAFWEKLGFVKTGEISEGDSMMELIIK